jgi:arylsulfatase A-like enzyme
VVYFATVPLAGLVARACDWPLARARVRARRGALYPRRVALALGVLLVLAFGWTVPHLEFSPLAGEPAYSTLAPRPAGPGPNVVFVTIDTLRADHLGCYGYPRPTSPFIDGLASEGTLCKDASASASWTKPSTGTLFTGLHPSRHGALYHGSLLHVPDGKQTLAEAFRSHGYVTAGFVANPNLKRVFAFDRGFDVYFDSPVEDTVTLACIRGTWFGRLLMEFLRHQFNWNYENDCVRMNSEVLAWLEKNRQQRFFLYLHYIDPHIPYDPPARYRDEFAQDHGTALFNERKRRVGIDLYDGEIRYCDEAVKALVAKLREYGLWEDTLLVLTSDHGEEFFEHGGWLHGRTLYEEQLRIPLVVRVPDAPPRVLPGPAEQIDVAPTLLELAGAPVTAELPGRSLVAEIAGGVAPAARTAFATLDRRGERGATAMRAQWKLLFHEQVGKALLRPPFELFALSSDPGERRDLVVERPLRRRWLEGELAALERRHRSALPRTGAEIDRELEERLRALGYLN